MSDEMTAIKQIWDDTANPVLEAHGLSKMDYRSHKEKGDDLLPQVKMGVQATQLERQGKRTRLGDINRDIKQKNEIIFESRRQYERETDTFIKTSNRNITERKRTFEQTEYSITYISDRLELNLRERAFRLSLVDETNENLLEQIATLNSENEQTQIGSLLEQITLNSENAQQQATQITTLNNENKQLMEQINSLKTQLNELMKNA